MVKKLNGGGWCATLKNFELATIGLQSNTMAHKRKSSQIFIARCSRAQVFIFPAWQPLASNTMAHKPKSYLMFIAHFSCARKFHIRCSATIGLASNTMEPKLKSSPVFIARLTCAQVSYFLLGNHCNWAKQFQCCLVFGAFRPNVGPKSAQSRPKVSAQFGMFAQFVQSAQKSA